jgi:tetratricopeptide (TPR) repeat protein
VLERKTKILISVGLFLLTWATYLPVKNYDFITYDDPDYITQNPHVKEGLTLDGIKWAFTEIHGEGTYWHPITWVSHMVDIQVFGLKAGPQHLENLLFHSLNVLLLFLILHQFTGAVWRSGIVAGLFALHPLQVDTVAWIAERKNVLSGIFWLLSMWAYGMYAKNKASKRRFYVLAVFLFILGLMCKPVLVTWPVAMLLLDFWPLKRFGWNEKGVVPVSELKREMPGVWPLLLEKIPFLVPAFLSSFITFQSHKEMGMTEIHGIPFWLRLENAFVSYARYLKKAIWPNDLAILYPHPGEWPDMLVISSALLLIAITGAVLFFMRRKPYLLIGWLWFLGVLLPASGIVQVGVQSMADRFAYLPMIGIFVMAVWGLTDLSQRISANNMAGKGLAVVSLLACVLATSNQLKYWSSNEALYEHAVHVTDRNYVMLNNLAYHLLQSNRVDEAERYLQEAVSYKPDMAEAHFQLGLLTQSKKHYDEAEKHLSETIRLQPLWPGPYFGLAAVFVAEGRPKEAILMLEKGLGMKPDNLAGQTQLASLLVSQGKVQEGIAFYQSVLRTKPDYPEVMNNLAWIYATSSDGQVRNGAEAVRLAEEACRITKRQDVMFLGTLAAAYAEAGRVGDAETAAGTAIQLATEKGNTELAEINQKLLSTYQKRMPYHETNP